jgi:hypothetical protein
MSIQSRDQGNPARADVPESNLGVLLLRVAWLAILLGLGMEVVLLLANGFGDTFGLGSMTAGLVKNVSWSVMVCVGLAVGATISKIRVPLMGFPGFVAAPLAFEVSRVLHKGTLGALAVEGTVAAGPSPLLLALIKGIGYGCLGLTIAWVSRRSWGGAGAHAAVGLAVGILFGGAILVLQYGSGSTSVAELFPGAINELLFPVGCSLVLFSGGVVGKMAVRDDTE